MNSNKNIFYEQQLFAIKIADIFTPKNRERIMNMNKKKTFLPSPETIFTKEIVLENDLENKNYKKSTKYYNNYSRNYNSYGNTYYDDQYYDEDNYNYYYDNKDEEGSGNGIYKSYSDNFNNISKTTNKLTYDKTSSKEDSSGNTDSKANKSVDKVDKGLTLEKGKVSEQVEILNNKDNTKENVKESTKENTKETKDSKDLKSSTDSKEYKENIKDIKDKNNKDSKTSSKKSLNFTELDKTAEKQLSSEKDVSPSKLSFNRKDLYRKRDKSRFNFASADKPTDLNIEKSCDENISIPDYVNDLIFENLSKIRFFKIFKFGEKIDNFDTILNQNDVKNDNWAKFLLSCKEDQENSKETHQ